MTMNTNIKNNQKEIYLAGGCFWGVQAYFKNIEGILETEVGYANGSIENPSYEEVCSDKFGFVETVKLIYDFKKINLYQILDYYFRIIDPTSINKQGNDIGTQYRTGIYYTDLSDKQIAYDFINIMKVNYTDEIVVEVKALKNYYKAEEYHQDYLDKNPNGYCHIDLSVLNDNSNFDRYKKPKDEEIRQKLTKEQYEITQNAGTEIPFTSEYDNFYKKGIYVDIVTGQPLFSSTNKFDAGCGWPSFSKPISNNTINYYEDNTLSRRRVEVQSKSGDTHLGHVFNDGPEELGGLRYCINGAALKFIPYEDMEKEGYGNYKKLVE